jgi:isocitrate dehydrogenase
MPVRHASSGKKTAVTIIPGDGVGPECTRSAQRLLDAAGAQIAWEERQAGASCFRKGVVTGVPEETIESVKRTRVVLKGPLETPVGYGEKSANVTLRKLFETFANIRPVREFPNVKTPYSGRGVDLVIVRENVEDLYAGIEHMQTPGVAQCLKLMSRNGCEKIVRLAFEVARAEGRKKVTCATKSNIMKLTEGTMKRSFEAVAKEYSDIAAEHIIVDNAAHQLVKKPEQFDVIVTSNMNGDILSDLASALVGGLGFAPGANLGSEACIFEAVHGSAPKYAGKNNINPTAVIMSAVMLLRHIGDLRTAAAVENALMYTWEEGKARTRDVVGDAAAVSTTAYTDAIIGNLGKKPRSVPAREYKPVHIPTFRSDPAWVVPKTRRVAGVDVFVEANFSAEEVGRHVAGLTQGSDLTLKMVGNRGTRVFPAAGATPSLVDHFQCRLMASPGKELDDAQLFELLSKINFTGKVRWNHIEKLQEFDGAAGFTKAQGED